MKYILIFLCISGIIFKDMSFRGVELQKVVVLINNKSDFRYKQSTNLKNYQVEYLDVTKKDLKRVLFNITTDILILNEDCLNNAYNLLSQIVRYKSYLVVFIAKNLLYGLLANILEEANFILVSEDNLLALGDIIRNTNKIYQELLLLKKKYNRLEDANHTDSIVRQAKLKIMKDLNLSEDEAYKYIINLAMKNRKKKSEIAKMIIGGMIL